MWREHVIIEDEKDRVRREARSQNLRPFLAKAVQMSILYAVGAVLIPLALPDALGIYSRYERGFFTIGLLWLCHWDAASWRPSSRGDLSPISEAMCKAAEAARGKTWWLWGLTLVPVATGLMAMPWHVGPGAAVAQIARALFLWLNGLGIASCWLAVVSPKELAAIEASSRSRWGRVWATIVRSLWPTGVAMLAWHMFCKAAGIP